jgi:hypothetical protein
MGNQYSEDSIFSYFNLRGIDNKISSNTIIIIIDMLSKEESEKEWTKFMKYFGKKTMFLFFKWPYYSKK